MTDNILDFEKRTARSLAVLSKDTNLGDIRLVEIANENGDFWPAIAMYRPNKPGIIVEIADYAIAIVNNQLTYETALDIINNRVKQLINLT